ncbi:MAG: glycogen debranching enzyme family protein [Alistipes sp.]|nr:glycogen debranching enzyme family protein [Alistipes sp.]
MPGLTFDKRELGNLEYSLQREMLATDRRGGYMSTTIVGCNTRKYHGLIVAPIDMTDETYVLLSSLDETIVQHDQSFNLALHRFRGVYEPRGHKYITDFEYTPCPTITYRVGGVILKKELLWIHKRTHLMIRYTLVDAHSETKLRLRPFLAFRNKHSLSKANMEANVRSYPVRNGVKNRLYDGFPWLHMQMSKDDARFIPAPDWYYDFEYQKEIERGYEGYEDLLTTGYFEMDIKKGESIIFSASVDEMASSDDIVNAFEASIARRTHKIDFRSCLHHSARQFIIRRPGDRTEVVAGYPWYGAAGRSTFIALPGLTLEQGYKEDCMAVLDTMVGDMHNGDFAGSASAEVAADAPLWFFWTLQQLEAHIGSKAIWERYGAAMKSILAAYRSGFYGGCVALHENGLIWASRDGYALTWMNSVINGQPQTPRDGYTVEINALWYNAVSYALALAKKYDDKAFVEEWKALPKRTKASFIEKFYLADEGYLADRVDMRHASKSIRCNQIIACGLDYCMLDEQQIVNVLLTVRQHLLTPYGMRSLSPEDPRFEATYKSNPIEQEAASKNGAVWVWPMMFYFKSMFRLNGERFLARAEEMFEAYDDHIQTYCIGSVAEYYDANPPFAPRGAVSQAWSVGAMLYIRNLLDQEGEKAAKAAKAAKRASAKSTKVVKNSKK